MTKEMCLERLNKIIEKSEGGNYNYEVKISDWAKDEKDRTYLSIVETREDSKHYVKREYGYYDNVKEEYISGKNDLTKNYNFRGSEF